ncbi:PRC-barrel domain-containing protein [Winogradskyella forsetii]|uniref:PRC-barrel domain-containing protein n=1 Tax=Winogradskyella forsetii TaxID=2686077 RepID=UPI0015B820FC|nr:PRC-barrel domain-containing protein [Winogradskyella forsetii]
MNTDKEKSLYYLEELSDYKVANSNKDVRGWEVKDKDGRVVGKVDNLLVNKNTERVVYLDIEVDTSIIEKNHKPFSKRAKDGVHEFLNEDGENHIILPIGLAHLNLESELVFTKSIDYKTFAETKRKKKGTPVYRDYEIVILDSYNRDGHMEDYPEDDSLYDRDEYRANH